MKLVLATFNPDKARELRALLDLPGLELAGLFEFQPLSLEFFAILGGILCTYMLSAEMAKRVFYRRAKL